MPGLIRSDHAPVHPAFSFQDIESQARAIIERAERNADALLRQAEQRAAQLIARRTQEGYESGFADGRAAGLEKAHREARAAAAADAKNRIEALAGTLSTTLAEFDHSKRRMLAAAESGLIALAVAIARRVCKTEAGRSSEAALANVRQLLEMVRNDADVRIRVSRADHQAVQELAQAFLRDVDALQHVEVVVDEVMTRGDCRLETRSGAIDASIEAQLDRIAEQICLAHADRGGES